MNSAGTQVEHQTGAAATIRAAKLEDISETIAVHKAAFPGFFLTMLGNQFLYELYRGFWQDPASIWLVANHNSRVIGFVVGTTEPASLRAFAGTRRRLRLAPRSGRLQASRGAISLVQ